LGWSFRLGYKNISRLHHKWDSYNAYLVFGEDKVALIDNTYPGSSAQMWGRIEDAFEKEGKNSKIDVIIQNHIEKDHSGALPEIHKKFPENTHILHRNSC
jgi:flavorubredoxin